MSKRISRRQLLQGLAIAASKLAVDLLSGCAPSVGRAEDTIEPRAFLPLIGKPSALTTATPAPSATPTHSTPPTTTPEPSPTNTLTPHPPPTASRVVHVHNEQATHWSGQVDYWNYVDQGAVDDMVDQGLMALTGTSTVANAWQTLIPNYQPGQGIAIKVNFNNTTACDDADAQIDGLIQPVNSVVRGLKQRGVEEADVWIYDASRRIPDRFVNGSLYSGVRFFDAGCRNGVSWSSNDPNAHVAFSPPPGAPTPPATRIDDLLIDCAYLINMPILKPHRIAGATLTFKNHFGDITEPWKLHSFIRLTDTSYRSDYNPLVDIYRNPHVGEKTVLIVGDALLAAHDFDGPPSTWTTFGQQVPNSLIFSTDPVAIDCVMCDFLNAELGLPDGVDDYLRLAQQANLGVYERGNPWGSGYDKIDYRKLTLPPG